MWMAQEHGKTDDEDLLTSAAFGLLRYLPWEAGLLPVLRAAGVPLDGPITEVRFWPLHDRTEPDVVVATPASALVIEAKLWAGFQEAQLGREWRWLQQQYPGRTRHLLTITGRRYSKRSILHRLQADLCSLALTDVVDESRVHTMHWSDLPEQLRNVGVPHDPGEHRLLGDLENTLARFGVFRRPFRAWPEPQVPLAQSAYWYGPRGLHRYFGMHVPETAFPRPTPWYTTKGSL